MENTDSSMPVTDLAMEQVVTAGETYQIDLVTWGPSNNARAGVLELIFADSAGNRIEVPDWPHHSSLFGEYLYLRAKQDQPRRMTLLVTAPAEATRLRLTGHAWSEYEGLKLLAPPRIVRCEQAVSTVNESIGGGLKTGIALAAVHACHHVPFNIGTLQVEIPIQGNLRPVQQMLYLRFFAEDDSLLCVSQGTEEDSLVVEIQVESHAASWRVHSRDIAVPDRAAYVLLSGPPPGHDSNPVTVLRLPGLRWKPAVEESSETT
ncbi:hypothetical protein [Citricoccus sp. NR2]|uniref:hypothetical protein n=1 Tax=Citricoccus sp. NR2 TaxID=3004095 RepID=UPI0022DE6D31|nr:hypothetical protein [Citricoccus sp. NR2]WBL18577.1 hypothetical protein O1A05_12535 [Citricoccus sp. NR2]